MPADKNRRVLVIDDNRAIHDDFRKILSPASAAAAALDATETAMFWPPTETVQETQFEIDSAYQGQEGVLLVKKALAAGRPYAMAFVDVRMPPGMDGVETTRMIWELDPNLQIVLCTAYSDHSWDEIFEKLGHRDGLLILKKPFDPVEAFQLAHALTEKWWLHQQSRRKTEELESRVAERTAQLSQERLLLRTLIDNLPDGIYTKDTAGRKTMANPADLKVLGCKTEAEAIGKNDFDLFSKDIAEKFWADDQKVIQGQPVINREEYLLDEEGRKRWLLTSKLPLRDQNGKIVGLIGIGRDITERKQAEETLRQSHDELEKRVAERTAELSQERLYLRTLIDSLPDYIFIKDRQSRFLINNLAHAQVLGATRPNEVVGKTDREIFPPQLANQYYADEQAVMKSGQPLNREEVGVDRRTGEARWLQTTKVPLRDKDGKIIGLIGISRNITERKQAEETLRQSHDELEKRVAERTAELARERRLLRTLINNLPDGIYTKDTAGRKTMANPADLKVLGCKTEAEAIGKNDFDLFSKDIAEKFWADDQKVIQGQPVINREEFFLDEEDRKRWLLTSKLPLHDQDGKIVGLIGIGRDITERKQAEDALRRQNEYLTALQETMLDVVSQLDLNRLLENIVKRAGQLMGTSTGNLDLLEPGDDHLTPQIALGVLAKESLKHKNKMGEGLVGKVWQTGQPMLVEDYDAWPGRVKDHQESLIRSIIVVPLISKSGFVGVLGLAHEKGSNRTFGPEALQQLSQFAQFATIAIENARLYSTGQQELTKRKQAEEVLRQSREEFKDLFDNAPVGFHEVDAKGRLVRINNTELKMLGYSAEELLGQFVWKISAEEEVSRRAALAKLGGEPPPPQAFGRMFRRKDGSTFPVLINDRILRGKDSAITGIRAAIEDDTDRKQAEEAVRLSEERLLKVIAQTRCILNFGQVEGPAGWRERALNPETPFHWDFPVLNEEAAQKIVPLELAAGERYEQAWSRSRNRADHAQMNWNSGNAFLNDLPFYRNEFRCVDKHGVGHWMQQFVTVRKLAENRWEIFGITTDISDLKRIEAELRESQALYHSLVDQMPAGVFRKDPQGRYVFVNSTFCRLKDMTPDQFLGKTVLEVGTTDAVLATRGASHHATIMQSGNQIEDDEVYSRADGEIRDYHIVKSPVFDSAGKIVGTQGILFDITERKRAEQALEQAFQRQQGISRLHENLLASRPLHDKLQLVTETIVRLFDADFCRIWLTRPGDLCEQGCMHALATEGPHVCRHRETCLHLLASAGRYTHLDGARHRRVPFGAYKIGLIAEGKEAKFLINDVQQNPRVHDHEWAKELGLVSFAGYRLQSPGGAPLGVLALFARRPLTAQEDVLLENLSNATTSVLLTQLAEDETRRELAERQRAEESLRWSETELQVILESTADGILAVDSEGKTVIKSNRRFADLLRVPQSLIAAGDNRALWDFALKQLSDPGPFLKRMQSLYGTDVVDTYTLVFKDGRVVERYAFPMIMDGVNIGRVWSFRDITERKRQEDELKQKNAEMERFTYTVSHDLKSPLVTVKTFLGYLEQDLARPDMERVKQDVTYMHGATKKMGLLLDELLNLARVGRKSNPPVRVTFRELAEEAVRLVAGRISAGGVKVQVADAVVTLEGDRPRLMEIWQNLVENACKFMGKQSQPQVEIGVEQRGPETVFFVRDNGMGIDPRYQAKVFGLFEKLDPTDEGTGMGLALVKRIVELYQGRVWVESAGTGQGANFLFTLPGAVMIYD